MLQTIIARLFPARSRADSPYPAEAKLQLGVTAVSGLPIEMSLADACKHILMTGATGSGVSTQVESLLQQQTRNGFGYVIIDTRFDSDLRDRLYAAAHAAGREDEFVSVNFDEPARGHTVDLLEGAPDIVAGELLQLLPPSDNNPGADFYRQQANYALTVLLGAFQATGLTYTVMDLVAALTNPSAMAALEFAVPEDGEAARRLKRFLDQYRSGGGELDSAAIRNQLGGMAGRLALVAMGKLGQVLNSDAPEVSLTDVVASNKLCYIALPVMGKCATAIALGRVLTRKLLHAVSARTTLPNRLRNQPTMLVFDSLASYAPSGLEASFSPARAAGVSIVIPLHSSALGQLDPSLKEVLAGNTWTKLFFRQGSAADGSEAEKLMGAAGGAGPTAVYSAKILQHLPLGQFAALLGCERLLVTQQPVREFNAAPYQKLSGRQQPDLRTAIQLTRFVAEAVDE